MNLIEYTNKYPVKDYSKEENLIAKNKKPFNAFSFLNGTKKSFYNEDIRKNPIPLFIELEKFRKVGELGKSDILYGLETNNKDGLVLTDPEIIKKFKGLVGEIISQLFKALMGKPISLPVKIFEPKSTLSRICDYWLFAPKLLNKATKEDDNLKRFKIVIAFAVAGLYTNAKQLKPFNPLLGETFEGEFLNDGAKIYCEHISHHPTISSFYLSGKDKKYYLSASFEFVTNSSTSFNPTVRISQKGPVKICFNNKDIIEYNMPVVRLNNTGSEKNRSSNWIDEMIFVDIKNNLKAIISFGKNDKNVHEFSGGIFHETFPLGYVFNNSQIEKEKESKNIKKCMKNEMINKISGSWLKGIYFDEEELWSIDRDIPTAIIPNEVVLPSDGRYREDLIWLFNSWETDNEEVKKKYEQYSQTWKMMIEDVQRKDRKERKDKKPKK
jgi:hypothetical protein